jgi:hypothetical protein
MITAAAVIATALAKGMISSPQLRVWTVLTLRDETFKISTRADHDHPKAAATQARFRGHR